MDKFHIDVKPGGFVETASNKIEKVFQLEIVEDPSQIDYTAIIFRNQHGGHRGMLYITRQALDELAQQWLQNQGYLVLKPHVIDDEHADYPPEGDLVLTQAPKAMAVSYWLWENDGDPENPKEDYRQWFDMGEDVTPTAVDPEYPQIWYEIPRKEEKDE